MGPDIERQAYEDGMASARMLATALCLSFAMLMLIGGLVILFLCC